MIFVKQHRSPFFQLDTFSQRVNRAMNENCDELSNLIRSCSIVIHSNLSRSFDVFRRSRSETIKITLALISILLIMTQSYSRTLYRGIPSAPPPSLPASRVRIFKMSTQCCNSERQIYEIVIKKKRQFLESRLEIHFKLKLVFDDTLLTFIQRARVAHLPLVSCSLQFNLFSTSSHL